MSDYSILFGVLGGTLGNILFLPQIRQALKTKLTRDVSVWTYILITLNALFWTMFGLSTNQPVIYIANIISSGLSLLMIGLKRRHG